MKPLLKVAARNGILGGVIGFGLLVGLYYMGRHPSLIPVYLDFRIVLFGVFIFFTLREVRDYHQNGVLYFPQGIFVSFLFTICYAVVSSALLWILMALEPAFVQEYVRLSIEQLTSLPVEVVDRIGRDVYQHSLDTLPRTRPFDLVSLYFVQSFLISFFVSVILSVILRKQPKADSYGN